MSETLAQALASNHQLVLLCQQLQRDAGRKGAVFSVIANDKVINFLATAPDLDEEAIVTRMAPAFVRKMEDVQCADLLRELVDNDTGEWSSTFDEIMARARRLLRK
ncbi:hypothetical protein UFOVP75_167 [uncultured Caudovirales phage]|uniref:Uncharacterized protein n=1 Tax=uncultured Caudovirales phage TaxID=2100421 RepID=A0A6J5L669_9CAUD|nr:hypothetical protein UFOVP75_167 [uncultured Caudovirales phage]